MVSVKLSFGLALSIRNVPNVNADSALVAANLVSLPGAGLMSKVVHDENNITVKPMGMNMNNFTPGTCTQMQINMGTCSIGIGNSSHDWAVKLKTQLQDGAVTVSWEVNEDVTVVKSATWSWRLGEIEFDKELDLLFDDFTKEKLRKLFKSKIFFLNFPKFFLRKIYENE